MDEKTRFAAIRGAIEAAGMSPAGYSVRGMSGRCLSAAVFEKTSAMGSIVKELANKADGGDLLELLELVAKPGVDDCPGRGTVLYWPKVEWRDGPAAREENPLLSFHANLHAAVAAMNLTAGRTVAVAAADLRESFESAVDMGRHMLPGEAAWILREADVGQDSFVCVVAESREAALAGLIEAAARVR